MSRSEVEASVMSAPLPSAATRRHGHGRRNTELFLL